LKGEIMSVLICYCYGYDEEDIRADVSANGGRSLILERILAEKRQGACRCAETHPERR
jgi:hypothetical protein